MFDSGFSSEADTEGGFTAAFATEDEEVFAGDGVGVGGSVKERVDFFFVSVLDGEVPLTESELGGEAGLLQVHFGGVPVADGVDEYNGDDRDVHEGVVAQEEAGGEGTEPEEAEVREGVEGDVAPGRRESVFFMGGNV